jgi:hypothetical protein
MVKFDNISNLPGQLRQLKVAISIYQVQVAVNYKMEAKWLVEEPTTTVQLNWLLKSKDHD